MRACDYLARGKRQASMEAKELGLNDDNAVIQEATISASHFMQTAVVYARECAQQGMFSRTVEVQTEDGRRFVVQLRTESVNEQNAQQAHSILGDLVPVPTRVIRESTPVPYTYIMRLMPGATWLTMDLRGWEQKYHIEAAGKIGELIGRCCRGDADGAPAVIDELILPRLRLYMEWDEPAVVPHKPFIQSLLDRVNELRKLPVCFTHWDINLMNVMVRDNGEVSGLLDWEESYWMPVGMNTHVIARLSAWNKRGKLVRRPYSKAMEWEFWRSFFRAAPREAKSLIPEITLAKNIGLVLATFNDASNPPHPSHIGVFEDSLGFKVIADASVQVLYLHDPY